MSFPLVEFGKKKEKNFIDPSIENGSTDDSGFTGTYNRTIVLSRIYYRVSMQLKLQPTTTEA